MKTLQVELKTKPPLLFLPLLLLLWLGADFFWLWGIFYFRLQLSLVLLSSFFSCVLFLSVFFLLKEQRQRWAVLFWLFLGVMELGFSLGLFNAEFQFAQLMNEGGILAKPLTQLGFLKRESSLHFPVFGCLYLLQGIKIALACFQFSRLVQFPVQSDQAKARPKDFFWAISVLSAFFIVLTLFNFLLYRIGPLRSFSSGLDSFIFLPNGWVLLFHLLVILLVLHERNQESKNRFGLLLLLLVCDVLFWTHHFNIYVYLGHFSAQELYSYFSLTMEQELACQNIQCIETIQSSSLRAFQQRLSLTLGVGFFVLLSELAVLAFFVLKHFNQEKRVAENC